MSGQRIRTSRTALPRWTLAIESSVMIITTVTDATTFAGPVMTPLATTPARNREEIKCASPDGPESTARKVRKTKPSDGLLLLVYRLTIHLSSICFLSGWTGRTDGRTDLEGRSL